MMKMKNSFPVVALCLFLAGCGSANKPAPADLTVAARPISLSGAQQKVVSDGVREMVAKLTVNGGESAKLSQFRAFQLNGGGVHVCGDVSYQMEPGKAVLSAPYYLELEEQGEQSAAKRGQVGFDELKKSKVTFMCRHLNGG